jgi:hypothetical protein
MHAWGGNSSWVFELFIMISNAYEIFNFFYDVVFNNSFRKEKKWIQSNGTKKKKITKFLNIQKWF